MIERTAVERIPVERIQPVVVIVEWIQPIVEGVVVVVGESPWWSPPSVVESPVVELSIVESVGPSVRPIEVVVVESELRLS